VIVFDEPFSNLDYAGVREVLARMVALHRSGRTILLTTHDLGKVTAHAGRLIFMQAGRVVCDAAPAEALARAEAFGVRRPRAAALGVEALSWLA
jgi:biotin transport system ATP-binding protein